jgi:ribosome maturation protein SDO1
MPQEMLVRYRSGKETFEVATHPGAVTKYREGTLKSLDEVLVSDVVFTDYHKRLRASELELKSVFGENYNKEEVLDRILRKGDFQLSAAERRQKLEQKRNEIIEYVHKNFVDPKTHLPIPRMRIEQALETVRPRLDMDQSADRQVALMMSKLSACMPMKKHQVEGTLRVPHGVLGASNAVIRSYCTVAREHYTSEGAVLEIMISPGDYDAFIKALNNASKGNFHLDIAGAAASAAASTEEKPGKKTKPKGTKGRHG